MDDNELVVGYLTDVGAVGANDREYSFEVETTLTGGVSAGVVLPVHRDLNGSLQFTTRRQVSLGVVYLFES